MDGMLYYNFLFGNKCYPYCLNEVLIVRNLKISDWKGWRV